MRRNGEEDRLKIEVTRIGKVENAKCHNTKSTIIYERKEKNSKTKREDYNQQKNESILDQKYFAAEE